MREFLQESFADLRRAAGLAESHPVAPAPVRKKKSSHSKTEVPAEIQNAAVASTK